MAEKSGVRRARRAGVSAGRAVTRASSPSKHELPAVDPPGQTPLRVLTIAGSDSGGGAGIQADLRTFALLGVHALVAVTAVTVQNSLGVKGFHEIPVDVIAGQIEAVASDIGVQAAKTGMLASSEIIDTVADDLARAGAGRHGAAGRRPGVRVHARRPAAASVGAGFASKRQLFPLATLVTPNLDEVRLLVGHRRRRRRLPARGRAGAARTRPAVGAGQGRAPALARRTARTCCSTAPTSTSSTRTASTPATTTAPATRWPPPPPAHWRTATRCPTRWRSASGG